MSRVTSFILGMAASVTLGLLVGLVRNILVRLDHIEAFLTALIRQQ